MYVCMYVMYIDDFDVVVVLPFGMHSLIRVTRSMMMMMIKPLETHELRS